ncbi:MAG: hypothetical protein HQ554_05170 [FCB group bacterium]|nr:hypothetical protein [FCB group bacterium]
MEENLRFSTSPNSPLMEVVDNMVLHIFTPYSKDLVTILINPNIMEYQKDIGNKRIKINRFLVMETTKDTKTITFDFEKNNVTLLIFKIQIIQ